MAVGFPAGKPEIDNRAGGLVTALRDDLYRCSQFSTLLQSGGAWTDANLILLGYTQAEVTTLKAAFTDLTSLYNVAHANGTVLASNDFFFSAKLLCGVA